MNPIQQRWYWTSGWLLLREAVVVIVAVVLTPSWLHAQAVAPTNSPPAWAALVDPPWFGPTRPLLQQRQIQVQAVPAAKTAPQVVRVQINAPASPSAPLKPGVYQTFPYSCLVVVPGPCPDDKSVIGRQADGGGEPGMPTIKPDLQFIPRSTGNNLQNLGQAPEKR